MDFSNICKCRLVRRAPIYDMMDFSLQKLCQYKVESVCVDSIIIIIIIYSCELLLIQVVKEMETIIFMQYIYIYIYKHD